MMKFIESILHGYSQVFLQKNAILGVLIMIGLGIASPVVLAMTLLGALTALGMGLALGASKTALETGLYCFNGVLIGASVSVFVKQMPATIIVTVIASIIGSLIFYLLTKNHLTALSFPFVLVTWVVILSARYIK